MPEQYSERRLAGIRASTLSRKQATIDQLSKAIESLEVQGTPVTAQTIRAECGLEYTVYARNPEALALFRAHSTALASGSAKKKRAKGKTSSVSDPLLANPKPKLVTLLRNEMQRREEAEKRYQDMLQETVQREVQMARLEAELAQYRTYLQGLRIHIQHEEHQDKKL